MTSGTDRAVGVKCLGSLNFVMKSRRGDQLCGVVRGTQQAFEEPPFSY